VYLKDFEMVFAKLAALVILSTLPTSTYAHPDLVLQIEALDTQIVAKPDDSELLIKRGDLYRRHENYSAAAADFTTARIASPENSLLDFYEGRLKLDSGEAAEAETYFQNYLTTHPQHSKAWMLRGKTNIQLVQPEAAAGFFKQAIKTTKKPSPDLYRSQILSMAAMGESEWNAAIEVVDEGLKHFGMEVSLLGLGVDIALASNQIPKAQQYLATLPDALLALQQWDTRLSATHCLASAGTTVIDHCRQQANKALADKVTAFTSQ
jgi:tetratricopeptide (TPR) repeat protein